MAEFEKHLNDKTSGLSGNRSPPRARKVSRIARLSTPKGDMKILLNKEPTRTMDYVYKHKSDSYPLVGETSPKIYDEKEVEEKPIGNDVSRFQDLPSIQLVSKVSKKREVIYLIKIFINIDCLVDWLTG